MVRDPDSGLPRRHRRDPGPCGDREPARRPEAGSLSADGFSLIVTNIRLRTENPSRPWATALGISDGRLAAVATAAEILKMRRDDCTIMDAHGQSLSLPEGMTVGSAVAVTMDPDGRISIVRSLVRSPGSE